MQDAWRAYLELALGLTEAPRKKAQDAVRRLLGSGGATAAQLQALAEEVVATGTANREALTRIVRLEVDRALARVGLATADEVAELNRRVQELERQLREPRPAPAAAEAPAPVKKAVAKKAVAKKAVAKKAPAALAPRPEPAEAVSAERPTTGKRVAAKKVPATPAKKAAPRKRAPGGGGAA